MKSEAQADKDIEQVARVGMENGITGTLSIHDCKCGGAFLVRRSEVGAAALTTVQTEILQKVANGQKRKFLQLSTMISSAADGFMCPQCGHHSDQEPSGESRTIKHRRQ